jgi:hypothetical protein
MGRNTGSRDLAPEIRGSVKRALMVLDQSTKSNEKGSGLTELLVEAFKEDALATLSVVSKFVPRELEIDIDGIVTHETWLGQLDDKAVPGAVDRVIEHDSGE